MPALWPDQLFRGWLLQDSLNRENALRDWFDRGGENRELMECRIQSNRVREALTGGGLRDYRQRLDNDPTLKKRIDEIKTREGRPTVLSVEAREEIAGLKCLPSVKFIQIFYKRRWWKNPNDRKAGFEVSKTEGDHTAVVAELPVRNPLSSPAAFLVIDATHMQFDLPIECQFNADKIKESGIRFDGLDYATSPFSARRTGDSESLRCNGAVNRWIQAIRSKPYIHYESVRVDNVYGSLEELGNAARSTPASGGT